MLYNNYKYRVELTRVHKKQLANQGKIFLVAHIKDGAYTYTSSYQILLATSEEDINAMSQAMFERLKAQYSL